jgi:very-short-patch-repair endonuclease
MSQYPFFHDAPTGAFARARQLRRNMTLAEQELWKHIRKNQIGGFRFRRQHPVAQFILDFYCHESTLAIELDGKIHSQPDQRLYDIERDQVIQALGIKVIRFKNEEVFGSLPNVLSRIQLELRKRKKSSPDGEELGGVN